jgi:hypothetical protein
MIVDLTNLAEQIRRINSNVIFSSEQSSNEDCPFELHQSYSLPDSDFKVRVTVICTRVTDRFELSCNIMTSDFVKLGEFQPLLVKGGLPVQEMQAVIDGWVRNLCNYLASSAVMIVRCLEKANYASDNSLDSH